MKAFRPTRNLLAIAVIMLALLLAVASVDYLYYRNRIYPGIQLKGIDLAGKTQDQVQSALDVTAIVFIGPEGRETAVFLREMGVIPNCRQVFDAAYVCGRKGAWPSTYVERFKLAREGKSIPFSYYLDAGLLGWSTDVLEDAFNAAPVNASFEVYASRGESKARLVPERYGYRLEKDKLIMTTQQMLNDPHMSFIVTVPMEKLFPDLTVLSLAEKGVEGLISSASTRFDPILADRVHNIKLAAGHLHNYLLAPGEILSLNALIGDTTPEKGYKKAPVMIGETLVPGYGGGLCQVSTTLYNAALMANLDIIERHNHHMTIPYISPGRDAAIVYGVRDLKVRNNRDHYILFNASIDYDMLRFCLFGAPMEEKVVMDIRFLAVYEPYERYVYTPQLSPGEKDILVGSPGYMVEVWKYVFREEEQILKKNISVDIYTPHPTIIRHCSSFP